MTYLISSTVPGLVARVRDLREAIASGGTETRTVADLQVELDMKLDLLQRLLDAAVKVKRPRRTSSTLTS